MSVGQPLRGFVAQRMAAKKGGLKFSPNTGPVSQFTPGSYTFTAPVAGNFKFVAWSAGGGNSTSTSFGCGSGAYGEITRHLTKGQTVAVVVGNGGTSTGGSTTLTFLDGTVATLTGGTPDGGSGGSGGTATGFDASLSGVAAGSASSGGNAPANMPFRGGIAGAATMSGHSPGGGGGSGPSTGVTQGGDGMVIVYYLPRA